VKILFVTTHPYLRQLYGGLQTSTHQLCRSLLDRGHKIAVLCGLTPGGFFAWKSRVKMQANQRLIGCKISRDMTLGYPVWRTWFPSEALEYVARREKPDLIVVMTGEAIRMALVAKLLKIPMLMQLQNVEFHLHGGRFEDLGDVPCIANSCFTMEKYHGAYGVKPIVIYPFMSLENYRTETTRENVTFINPVPQKGLDIAIKIARSCPEIPFSFVESWTLPAQQRWELTERLSELPNVTLLAPQTDMRKVYGRCKILLAPSVWEETYGMVATEAQISGIPVIASARGGLPESVGQGGILIDPDSPIEVWVDAVQKLWGDDAYYAELSAAALSHAQRPAMNISYQIDAYERTMLSAISGDLSRRFPSL
jgi:glycosyltransferase involved in cell wall biosynthesis